MSEPVPQPTGADPGWPALELVGDALVKYYDGLGYPVARPYAAAEAVLAALDAAGLLLADERRRELALAALALAADSIEAAVSAHSNMSMSMLYRMGWEDAIATLRTTVVDLGTVPQ